MPNLPASIADVVVIGVGDAVTGKFIDGRQSRQDRSTLRQMAVRLHGRYHNGNEKHLSSELLNSLSRKAKPSKLEQLGRREYALLAVGLGSFILAILPLLLHVGGSRWRPGIRAQKNNKNQRRGVLTE
jgi:Ca-activated chloride channel family protein